MYVPPVAGKRPLRLEKPSVKESTARRILPGYCDSKDEVEISDRNEGASVAAPTRELVAPYIQRMHRDNCLTKEKLRRDPLPACTGQLAPAWMQPLSQPHRNRRSQPRA